MRLSALLLALLLSACAAVGEATGNALVAYADFNGWGLARTDGNVTLALGDVTGELGVAWKVGIPFGVPFQVQEGEVFLKNERLGVEERRSLDEPLPVWARSLFLPGEEEQVEAQLGVELSWEDE